MEVVYYWSPICFLFGKKAVTVSYCYTRYSFSRMLFPGGPYHARVPKSNKTFCSSYCVKGLGGRQALNRRG